MKFSFTIGLRTNANACNGYGPDQSISGQVQAVGGSYFDVLGDDGRHYRAHVAPCTKLSANHKDHKLKYGDKVVAKGTYTAGNNISCKEAIALA